MREIKFRAWCEGTHKNMTFTEPHMEYNVTIDSGKYASVEGGWDIHGTYETIPLMQYTGLEDKNGKEIYEGDIVWADRPHEDWEEPDDVEKVYAVVVYNSPSFYAKYLNEDLNKFVSGQNGFILRPYNTVIGNIYQQPELIK